MSQRGTSSWRSRFGCPELCCGGSGNATAPAQDSESVPARVSASPQDRASVSLPLDQISRRTETAENAAPVVQPQQQNEPAIQPAINSQTSPTDSGTSDNDDALRKHQEELRPLWKEAIQKFEHSRDGGKLDQVLQNQKQINTGDSKVELTNLLSELGGEMERIGLKGKMAESIGKLVPHLNRIAIVGDVAVSSNPNPAALPWAVVRFLLLSITAGEDIRAKIVEGIAEIVILVFECSVYQELYLAAEASKSLSTTKSLRKVVIEALSQCIRFLALALCQQRVVAKALTDAFRLEDFSGYLKDLQKAKLQLHDAGLLCEMYHRSQDRDLLKDLHKLIDDMRHSSNQQLEREAKSKLKDLLLDPKDASDHIYHPDNSYCLEGTRQTVLQDINNWTGDATSPSICWLPGPAGSGKSTISRTVARDLKGRCLGGCFFFKKGAGNRANGRTVFSTIAYQLALNFPPVRQHIIDAVQEDPSSVMRSMNDQWNTLVRQPLDKVQDKQFMRKVVLIIDALDECDEDDRQCILVILSKCPDVLKVFITSRPEFDIESHFVRQQQFHREIALHRVEMVEIERDITSFLEHHIKDFISTYNGNSSQKHLRLSNDWPGSNRFQALVKKSFPLFIAAATFIRLIKDITWTASPDSKVNFIIQEDNNVGSPYGGNIQTGIESHSQRCARRGTERFP